MALSDNGVAQGTPVNLTGGMRRCAGQAIGGREDYAFSPDGTQVAFSVRGAAGEAWSTNFDIYKVAADGSGQPKNLTAENKAWDGQPAFSPGRFATGVRGNGSAGIRSGPLSPGAAESAVRRARALTQNWDRSINSFGLVARRQEPLFATADHL